MRNSKSKPSDLMPNAGAPFFTTCVLCCVATFGSMVSAGEVTQLTRFGQSVWLLRQGNTSATVAPGCGANVYSIQVDGVEYLHQPPQDADPSGVRCGVPVLYPTPNRVKNAAFEFGGKRVEFPSNAGPNFIHGLVNNVEWDVVERSARGDSASLTCAVSFMGGNDLQQSFPFPHRLLMEIVVREGSVSWHYTVDNQKGDIAVPFGFALHPYFVYQNERPETFLTIGATHWMESERQLPSGKLIPATDLDYPLDQPFSLEGRQLDDVYFGVRPSTPARIEFREVGRSIEIHPSKEFTHLVVWTPRREYFGVESQTCSTDAHNLHSAGFEDESHLQICPAGETRKGSVTYRFISKP